MPIKDVLLYATWYLILGTSIATLFNMAGNEGKFNLSAGEETFQFSIITVFWPMALLYIFLLEIVVLVAAKIYTFFRKIYSNIYGKIIVNNED